MPRRPIYVMDPMWCRLLPLLRHWVETGDRFAI